MKEYSSNPTNRSETTGFNISFVGPEQEEYILNVMRSSLDLSKSDKKFVSYINFYLKQTKRDYIVVKVAELEEGLEMSRKTIRRCLRKLLESHIIFTSKSPNIYYVNQNILPITNNYTITISNGESE